MEIFPPHQSVRGDRATPDFTPDFAGRTNSKPCIAPPKPGAEVSRDTAAGRELGVTGKKRVCCCGRRRDCCCCCCCFWRLPASKLLLLLLLLLLEAECLRSCCWLHSCGCVWSRCLWRRHLTSLLTGLVGGKGGGEDPRCPTRGSIDSPQHDMACPSFASPPPSPPLSCSPARPCLF